METTKIKLQVTHFSNTLGVLQCLRNITIKLSHLLRTPKIEEVPRHLHSLLIMDRGVPPDTQQQVMGRGILPVYIVGIISRHQRDTQLPAHRDKNLIYLLQLSNGVSLYFQVEITKYPLIPQSHLFCLIKAPFQNKARHLTTKTGRKTNKTFVILLKEFFIYPRLVIKTLKVCLSDQLY